MVFSSTIFLFVFLPITIILYYISKECYRNIILLICSLIFYAFGEPKFVLIMLISIFLNYISALFISKNNVYKKVIFIVAIIFNLGILFLFKYLDFSLEIINSLCEFNLPLIEIALPVGISFFTFQSLSYVIDVYTGKSQVQKNFFDLALYVALFPQLIAGPIVRYNTIAQQIKVRSIDYRKVDVGCKRFMSGFCKKVILSNNLALVSSNYFNTTIEELSIVGAWLGAICYTLQIYYDFSGYSDMAIGLGKLFGFDFEENFNYPYISKSISEFWKRWHISLGQYFRDYIYIPLGGSRVSMPKNIINLGIVWLLTGIWHGANYTFILWGMLYFVALVVEKYIIKPNKRRTLVKLLYMVFTLLFVNFAWVIFNSSTVEYGIRYCLVMLGIYKQNMFYDVTTIYYINEYWFFIVVSLLFSTPFAKWVQNIFTYKLKNMDKYVKPIMYFIAFMWAVSFLILGSHNPFIYFNF